MGGIDHAPLVVACDDGVMARRPASIWPSCSLTGKLSLTVALTKADRVDGARVSEVRAEVAAVGEFGFTHATLFRHGGDGKPGSTSYAHLRQLPERTHPQHQRFRPAIDRAFPTGKGAGLVVTGTALSGEVNVGDTLWLTGVDKPTARAGCMRKTSRSTGRGPVSELR